MEILETKLVERKVVTDVLCNKCGESCKHYVDTEHKHFNFNSVVLSPEFGHGDLDMEDFEVHLCEDCYAELERTFKIKPTKTTKLLG